LGVRRGLAGSGAYSASAQGGTLRAPRRTRLGWALFDWAQQPYFTLVGSFLFRPFFVTAVAATPAIGQIQIGLTGAAAGLVVALVGPLLGILLDRGSLKAWLGWTSLPFVLACAALWLVVPGEVMATPLALVCLTAAAILAEVTTTINNAMLPAIAKPGGIGRLSGFGVALGCFGGMAAAAIFLLLFLLPQAPFLGLDRAAHEPERFSGPFAALWYVLFLIPLFLCYPRETRAASASRPLRDLLGLLRALPRDRVMLRFLVGRMFIADAAAAVQLFGGIIAAATFGWNATEMALFGFTILAASGIGAYAAGFADDHLTPKVSVLLTSAMLIVAMLGIGSAAPDRVLYFFPVDIPADSGFLQTLPQQLFFAFAITMGVALGPNTGSMRSWMAELIPAGQAGRWFGLYAVAGRATAFAAPLVISLATALTQQVLSAVPVILLFLVVGILALVMVPAGRAAPDEGRATAGPGLPRTRR